MYRDQGGGLYITIICGGGRYYTVGNNAMYNSTWLKGLVTMVLENFPKL